MAKFGWDFPKKKPKCLNTSQNVPKGPIMTQKVPKHSKTPPNTLLMFHNSHNCPKTLKYPKTYLNIPNHGWWIKCDGLMTVWISLKLSLGSPPAHLTSYTPIGGFWDFFSFSTIWVRHFQVSWSSFIGILLFFFWFSECLEITLKYHTEHIGKRRYKKSPLDKISGHLKDMS